MKLTKINFIFATLFLFGLQYTFDAKAQSKATIAIIDSVYQNCLDQGENMLGCTQNYYAEMDSLLNVVYKKLIIKHPEQKAAIKQEEIKWLKTRDEAFKKLENNTEYNKLLETVGRDGVMMITDDEAKIVKERLFELINQLNR